MKLNRFIVATDYGTLKNDTRSNTLSVSVAANTTWNISSPILATATLSGVGTINAGVRARGQSSKYSTQWATGTTIYSDLLYSIPSVPAAGINTILLYCNLERISANTVRMTMATDGGAGSPDYKTEEAQTITFVFSTFLSPFD